MPIKMFFAAVSLAALAACSSFDVVEPKDGSIVTLPAKARVSMQANPRLSAVQVTVDGTDVSNQMTSTSTHSEGELSLPLGRHKVFVAADVDCSYCSGGKYRPAEERKICVVAAGPSQAAFKTPFAQGDNLSWASINNPNVSVAQNLGTTSTRWHFILLGGIGSNVGQLESIELPCRCLRSTQDAQNAQIGLSLCDVTDTRQQWRSFRMQLSGGKGFYRFENSALGLGDACLTEGPNNQLIQRSCNDTDKQLWAVQNNTTNQFETGQHPWFQ